MKNSCSKSCSFILLPVIVLICCIDVHASAGLEVFDTPVFESVPTQNVDAGQQVVFRVAASQEGDEPPWISTDFFDVDFIFLDNGDGTRTFSWRTGPDVIGQRFVRFLARNSSDLSVQSTLDVEINVLPALNPGPSLRIIAPDSWPIEPGQLVSIKIQAVDSSGAVPSLWLNLESRPDATFDDNGDGTRTFNWQAPDPIQVGGLGVSFEAEFISASAGNPESVVSHSLFLDYFPNEQPTDVGTVQPSLILPSVASVAPGERIAFRVVGVTPSGKVPNLRVAPMFEGVSFEDNGDGSRTFIWKTSPVDSGEWSFVFSVEDPEDGITSEEILVVTVAE